MFCCITYILTFYDCVVELKCYPYTVWIQYQKEQHMTKHQFQWKVKSAYILPGGISGGANWAVANNHYVILTTVLQKLGLCEIWMAFNLQVSEKKIYNLGRKLLHYISTLCATSQNNSGHRGEILTNVNTIKLKKYELWYSLWLLWQDLGLLSSKKTIQVTQRIHTVYTLGPMWVLSHISKRYLPSCLWSIIHTDLLL